MDTKINIAEILKDKPQGTKLYSPLFGNVYLLSVDVKAGIIRITPHRENESIVIFFSDGRYYNYPESEPLLFPSKEMQDWSKFAWKKGDVLVSNDSTTKVIFNGWKDDTYTLFRGAYALITHNDGKIEFGSDSLIFETCNYKGIEVEDDAQFYINYIERKLGGKLNLETLEIEKPAYKYGDIVLVDDTYLRESPVVLSPSDIKTSRPTTDSERQQLFDALAKEGKAWDAKKKMIVDLKPNVDELKPFDKVLVRNDKEDQWSANIFSYQVRDNMYYCLGECYWRYCIPYEGNESLLGTTKDVEG